MSTYNLILNSNNVLTGYNTFFKYKFIGGNFDIYEGAKLCISQAVIPYSWFNINSGLYGNNTFTYYFGNTSTASVFTLTDGNYTITDINNALQNFMIGQGHYLYNTATGQNLYYIDLLTNQTFYTNNFVLSNIPTTLPTGFTNPSGLFPFANGGYCPQISITKSGFGNIVGYTTGLYPSVKSTLSNYTTFGNTVPNINPVNAIVARCNLINNNASSQTDVLDTMSLSGTSFGSNINYVLNYEKWINLTEGSYDQLILYFQDQNYNIIQANDPNVMISLLLMNGQKKTTKLKMIKSINPLFREDDTAE